jgi:hypothetical protein
LERKPTSKAEERDREAHCILCGDLYSKSQF